jgi:hypothetical protein
MRGGLPLLLASFVVGCGGGKTSPKLVFDTDVRSAYVEVRPCRSPGEHSGLGAFTVWIDPEGKAAFDALWNRDPSVTALPEGSVVVKEIYGGPQCDPKSVDHWVAMRKEPGFDPSHGDWHWQRVNPGDRVVTDGRDPTCTGCHAGTGSCTGYGESAGLDYLCTVP